MSERPPRHQPGEKNDRPSLWDWLKSAISDEDMAADEPPCLLDDAQEAMIALCDAFDEPLRISVVDASGAEVSQLCGQLTRIEEVKEGDAAFAEMVIERDGITAIVRLAVEPVSHCELNYKGVIAGKLLSGASWSVGPLKT